MKRSSSENGECSRITQPQKRNRTRSGTVEGRVDLDRLDCPICYQPFTVPIFQCDNGHVVCGVCRPNLNLDKCPFCALPIGNNRCRAMESILESVTVPCRNAHLGCTKYVPYGREESNHEKEHCKFSQCSCPEAELEHCKHTGVYNEIYFHYMVYHLLKDDCFFTFGESKKVRMLISEKSLVLKTLLRSLMFVMQCIREPNGVYVMISFLAPTSPEVEKFSYRLSYSYNGEETHTHGPLEMKNVLKVSFQIPQEKEDAMFLPNRFLRGDELELELCIKEVV
ncbi:unnamed protein product [Microthlaspi erraticum]|uniref:RING-type E3 ubiquitin transferase n=1 Tax=Microthlaspi erraticum TaxID=1685480 RepID=A0A6D2IYV6_9BRAS|nr:unnamed protein product [Microthlaspi erraticum]